MKKLLATFAVLVLGTVSGYGVQVRTGYQSQFHVPHASKHANSHAKALNQKEKKGPIALAHHLPGPAKTPARLSHVRATNNSASTLGFVSATQIPAGGYVYDKTAMDGDFNGDGKKDLVTLAETYIGGGSSQSVASISVVLGNGDGTFKPPVLTTVNSFDPILVGDVNGDGKDDVIQVHPSSPSTVDVWLSNGDGTLTEDQSYQVSPASLVGGILADVNADGKLDLLAVDSQTPGLVRTLLGNGDGTFQAATSITLPTSAPSDLIFADFNHDGKIDFAGLDGNDQVNIYVQAGGNFVLTGSPLTNPDSVYDVCALQAGDLTGDGAAEVVTENCGDADEDTVTVYVNNGDGTFASGVYYAVAASGGDYPANLEPYAGVIADVNGDGKNDIVVTNYYGGDVTILTGNGDGTVNVPDIGYATGGYYTYLPAVVADFNGDGFADIVQTDNNYSYAYLQGYGDGTFRAAVDYYGAINDGSWPESSEVATGDFNGDGFPDFAVGNDEGGITIFLSRGDGSLQHGVTYGSLESINLAVADFNGDGKLDVVASDYYNGTVQLFNGVGDGTFTVGSTYSSGAEQYACPYQILTGDFNHDQHPDVAVVNYDCDGADNTVGILLNDGAGGFLSPVTYLLSDEAWAIAAGDLNNDGNTDLLVPLYYSSQYVAVLMGNSDGTFQSESDVNLVNGNTTYYNPDYITVADFDGDGNMDFAVSIDNNYTGNQGIAVALGNGDGTFKTPNLYSTTNQDFANFEWPYPEIVKSADINGDGILDLVYTNVDFSTVGVLFGNGNGTFGTPNEYPVGNDAFGIALADLNGDGALDVVTGNYASDAVTALLNANGSGSSRFTFGTSTSTATVTAGSAATYALNLTGINGYTGTVTFSCSGLPAYSSCSFSPSSIVASGSSQTTTLTLSTTAASAALVMPAAPNSTPSDPILWASLGGIGIFGLVLAGGAKRNRRQMAIVLGVLLLVMVFSLVGCGGTTSSAHSSGTPAGTYTVVVTATGTGGGAPTHSMNLTLIVQ